MTNLANINWISLGTEIVAGASVLHTVLPPWDFLDEFPTAQKLYKVFVYLVGYVALNARSTVYQKISVNNPNGPNANCTPTTPAPAAPKP
jgi:hypothetical protein